ncbi:concanavalin A-like lectin/glucanase domain-containing protein [Choanephora cucurbitarum]|nr:concanavalin A-like lectin/glucanase domain-containing protein [Choanephora cucurbitarum]
MYSVGWKKQLSYCTAFSVHEAMDVTKRYVRDWPMVLKRRTWIHEAALSIFLDDITKKYQQDLEDPQRLYDRRIKEFFELEEESKKTSVKEDEMAGRTSGALDWRLQRGETEEMKEMDQLNDDNQLPSFNLLGSTTLENKVIQLTRAISDQCGGIYLSQPIELEGLKGIEVEFEFRISNGQGGPAMGGADGFAFVIQSDHDHALGHGGCQLGYGGIRHSMAIEYDTYQSADRCADPSDNHISIQARKAPQPNSAHHDYSLGHTSSIPSFQTGHWFKSKVRLLTTGVIEIGVAERGMMRQVLKVSNQNFLEYVGKASKIAWIGFTASTGGLSQSHEIKWISMTEFR